jgi:hypothetical protein
MRPANCTCPTCSRVLKLSPAEELPAKVKCSRCTTKFMVHPNGTTVVITPPLQTQPAQAVPAAAVQAVVGPAPVAPVQTAVCEAPAPAAPVAAAPAVVAPVAGQPAPVSMARLGVVIGGGVLFLVATIVLIVVCFSGGDEKSAGSNTSEKDQDKHVALVEPEKKPDPVVQKPKPPENDRSKPPENKDKPKPPDQGKPVEVERPKPLPAKPKPDNSPQVNKAIDKGVKYLQDSLNGKVTINEYYGSRCGGKALAGLTLLSCGVKADDPAVVKAAQAVRTQANQQNQTYDMAICVWFLDKLNDPQDRQTIQTLALRLIASQRINGGWDYTSFTLTDANQKEMLASLKEQASGKKPPTAPEKPDKPKEPARDTTKKPPKKGGVVILPTGKPRINPRPPAWGFNGTVPPANLKTLPVFQFDPKKPLTLQATFGHEDNSLTQFVILALWSAQKYGVPAQRSLAMAEARFRASQNPDGTWAYTWVKQPVPVWNPPRGTGQPAQRIRYDRADSMTCAGLLGLAVGRGVRADTKLDQEQEAKKDAPVTALTKDPAVKKALTYLSDSIGEMKKAAAQGNGAFRPAWGVAPLAIRANAWGNLYFLWSLERVAVVYNLKMIGDKDWYAWGSKVILDAQQTDGSWKDSFPGVVDTCFALLFLKRVNVVKDLSDKLQKVE